MKNITVSRVEPTNPMITSYVNRIKSWDKEGNIKLEKDSKIIPFYAIYLGDLFLAASTVEFDKEKSLAYVSIVNGSINNYDVVQSEATQELYNIVSEKYGTSDINFTYTKRII